MKHMILKSMLFSSLLLLLTACTPTILTQPIDIKDTGQVLFSNITTNKLATGIKISGNVKKRTGAARTITIPGHIHITLKDKEGKELEVIQARTHRQYGNSQLWHFDGVLKTQLAEGSRLMVNYHQHR